MTAKHDCSETVGDRELRGLSYPCQRPATVEHDGKWYCWQHDPGRVKAEAEKRHADWEAKMDRKDAKYARIARNARLAELVTPELPALLERLARYVDTWGDWDTCNADTDAAHDLAASIREALGLEGDSET